MIQFLSVVALVASVPSSPPSEAQRSTYSSPVTTPKVIVEVANPRAVVQEVLPCGLRVLVAQDKSLPVAAVSMSVQVGTEDDPDKLPGLVEVLAYHLQQGNREFRPAAAMAMAHDVGGLAEMAVGPGQVRFESIAPGAALDRLIFVESQRFRAPTMNEALWQKSVSYAKRDRAPRSLIPRGAIAAAWDSEGLTHEGRRLNKKELEALAEVKGPVASHLLSTLFRYDDATLVVVSSHSTLDVLQMVRARFADLPKAQLKVRQYSPSEAKAKSKRLELKTFKGAAAVWTVPANPRAVLWAQIVCDAINRRARRYRSKRSSAASQASNRALSNLRCTYQADSHRGTLMLRSQSTNATLGLERLVSDWQKGKYERDIERRRKVRVRNWSARLDSPLHLASHLGRFQHYEQDQLSDPTGEASIAAGLKELAVELPQFGNLGEAVFVSDGTAVEPQMPASPPLANPPPSESNETNPRGESAPHPSSLPESGPSSVTSPTPKPQTPQTPKQGVAAQ